MVRRLRSAIWSPDKTYRPNLTLLPLQEPNKRRSPWLFKYKGHFLEDQQPENSTHLVRFTFNAIIWGTQQNKGPCGVAGGDSKLEIKTFYHYWESYNMW